MKVNIKSTANLQLVLDAVQHNADAHTTSATDIEVLVGRIERTLTKMLHKKDWVGLRFALDPNAQSFPYAGKGGAQSTQFEVERYPTGWFVTKVIRRHTQAREIYVINISDYSKQLALHAANPWVWNR